jgi:hypothetical protein
MQYVTRPQQVNTHDSRYDSHNRNYPTPQGDHFRKFMEEWADNSARSSEIPNNNDDEQSLSGWENEGGAL